MTNMKNRNDDNEKVEKDYLLLTPDKYTHEKYHWTYFVKW